MFKKPKNCPTVSPYTLDQQLGWDDLFPSGYFETKTPEDKAPPAQPADRIVSTQDSAFSQPPPLFPIGHLVQVDETLEQTVTPSYEFTPEHASSTQSTTMPSSWHSLPARVPPKKQKQNNPPPLLFTPAPVVTTNISVNFPASMPSSTLSMVNEDTQTEESKPVKPKAKPPKVRRKSKRLKKTNKKRKRITTPPDSSSSDEQRPLSQAEAKRKRNRDAARDYRYRKKKYVQSLENQVIELQKKLKAAQKKVRGLEIANVMLQSQVEEPSQTASSSAQRKRYQF